MPTKPKIWYSFMGGRSEEDHIGFYEPSNYDWTEQLEAHYDVIFPEIESYLTKNEEAIKPYFNKSLVTAKSRWRTSGFFFWTWPVRKNMKQCPETMRILKETVPGIISASISILESDTTIKPHRGDTNAIVRSHFALKVPAGLPECGFMVNDEKRAWEEGKLLLFNDAAEHTAWNHSESRRYVLLFDLIRPEYKTKKFRVSSMVLAGLIMQAIVQKISILRHFPRIILGMGLYTIAFCLNPVLRLRQLNY